MAGADRKIIELEEGWAFMRIGVRKLRNILEDVKGETQFSTEEYMNLYTCVTRQRRCIQLLPPLRPRSCRVPPCRVALCCRASAAPGLPAAAPPQLRRCVAVHEGAAACGS
jgi:hypothetical protein